MTGFITFPDSAAPMLIIFTLRDLDSPSIAMVSGMVFFEPAAPPPDCHGN